ncbi:MAG TPA: PAS domain-containing protein [Candidatus Paceibacterota bacterium]
MDSQLPNDPCGDKELYYQIIENLATPTFAINTDHKVILWNKACERLTGASAQEMIGTDKQWAPFYNYKRPTVSDLVIDHKPDDMGKFYSNFSLNKSVIEGGWEAEGWYENLGGKKRYIFFTALPIQNAQGEVIAAVETLEDITARVEEHEESVRMNLIMVDRELKMVELKKEVERLQKLTETK